MKLKASVRLNPKDLEEIIKAHLGSDGVDTSNATITLTYGKGCRPREPDYWYITVNGVQVMTIFNHQGLRAELVDGEAIALYAEDKHVLTMTIAEWFKINRAIPVAETVKLDVFG